MRVGFVHTIPTLVERFRTGMRRQYPEAESYHILNETLLGSLLEGEPRATVYSRVVRQLQLAAEANADFLVLTCPTVAPACSIARRVCMTPIVNMMDPVSAEAVRLGRRIGILCSTTTAPGPTAALLRHEAAVQGREIIVEAVVRPEAYTALHAGDMARHDAILTEAAIAVLPRVEVFVLAEATLAHLAERLSELGKPVLDSTALLMAEIGRRLALGSPAG